VGTNVPLPNFGPQGFQAPTDAQILAGVQADMNAAFGGGLNFSTSTGSAVNPTPQGQLAISLTAIISAVYAEFVNFTNQVNPAFAEGRMQDAIGNIYFIQRYPAQGTVVQCICTGAEGVTIPGGSIGTPPAVMAVDESGNQYRCSEGGVIPAGGSLTLPFVNILPGPIQCLAGTLNVIYSTIPGWDSITNPSDGVVGNDAESRAAFETRRVATVEGNSFGPVGAVIGAVANVDGVLDFIGYSNNTAAPVNYLGVMVPANSMFICVAGGSEADIGAAIFSKLNPGPPMFGNTTVTVYDDNPLYTAPIPYEVTFEVPEELAIIFSVVIHNGPTVPSDAVALIQNAIVNAFNGVDGGPRARIGSLLFASRYYSAVAVLGSWAQIVSLKIGSNNSPGAVFSGTIAGTVLTVDNLVSGSIAIGQILSDPLGRVAAGTRITGGASMTWSVDKTQTVEGASFTGDVGSPTTRLIVTAVTGTINIGDTVAGTGITAGTTILSQVSGTPGAAGTYELSATNTASSSSLTTSDTFTASTASLNDLQVQADQVPVTSAPLIYVTTG